MAGSSPAPAGRLMDLAAGVTAANYTRASSSGFELWQPDLEKRLCRPSVVGGIYSEDAQRRQVANIPELLAIHPLSAFVGRNCAVLAHRSIEREARNNMRVHHPVFEQVIKKCRDLATLGDFDGVSANSTTSAQVHGLVMMRHCMGRRPGPNISRKSTGRTDADYRAAA
jgi:hypothetical protein